MTLISGGYQAGPAAGQVYQAPPGYMPVGQNNQPTYMQPTTTVLVQPQPSVVVVGGCPACRVSIYNLKVRKTLYPLEKNINPMWNATLVIYLKPNSLFSLFLNLVLPSHQRFSYFHFYHSDKIIILQQNITLL